MPDDPTAPFTFAPFKTAIPSLPPGWISVLPPRPRMRPEAHGPIVVATGRA